MLINNPRFQKEFNDFSEQVSKISDEGRKNQINHLLMRLVNEIKFIDQQHEEFSKGAKFSSEILSDKRTSIQNLRQQISKKIEECSNAGLLK